MGAHAAYSCSEREILCRSCRLREDYRCVQYKLLSRVSSFVRFTGSVLSRFTGSEISRPLVTGRYDCTLRLIQTGRDSPNPQLLMAAARACELYLSFSTFRLAFGVCL